ncbi:trypsin-like peptidase domain-containing protein [Streptomyces sp. JHA19]|uniref:trypsin-like peptidase domain-containing protein n=2 Tax=unclassified Streptomyces TaxID=2593676 RepID=UPI0006E3EB91|nr:trypsin-like peptidase domain-containing protein [Streptomyces sp. JHA19]
MNEGKPTRAKWWNRPRPQEAPPGVTPAGESADGDFELAGPARPAATPAPDDDFPLPPARATSDGDFELAEPQRPPVPQPRAPEAEAEAAPGSMQAAPAASAPAQEGGPRPLGAVTPDAPERNAGAGTEPGQEATSAGSAPAQGDGPRPLDAVALERNAGAGTEPGQEAPAGSLDGHAEHGAGAGAAQAPAGETSAPAQDAAPAPAQDAAPAPAPAATPSPAPAPAQDASPRPLHDPDPYSTPPYGEPGPWAPAPPVQHPAAAPAHGTPAAAALPGQPAPHHPQAVSAQPVPPGALAQPVPVQPAPPSGPAQPVPHSAPAHAVPAQPTPTTSGPAHPTPPGAPAHAVPDPAFADAPPPTTPAASTTPVDPWRNYDPWARAAERAVAAAPLQDSGAGVGGPRRRRVKGALLVGALVIALVSGGVGGVLGTYLERNGGLDTVELPQAGVESPDRAADSVAGIAARALPSVVTLHVSGGSEQGTGTGFVLDERGHILTNNHVVEPAGEDGEISVTFHSGDTAEAKVVGRDSGYDLAVVKVKGVGGLRPLPLGNSENVQVGDPVVAIGAPFDLEGTVTSGIISAKQRPITAGGESGDGSDVSYVDALQTDAPINPGNSGGPLLDGAGRVVGINSAIRSAGSGAEPDGGQAGSIGLGFAIPVNQAKRVAEELIETGKATHPVIGVTLDMEYAGDGARVGSKGSDGGPAVTKGGPGAKAGIKPGDVITEIDGARVHSGEELIIKTRAHRPGDRLELTLKRGGKEITLKLTLGSSSGR